MSSEVPAGWITGKLKEFAILTKGLTYASSDYSDEHNGLPFLTLKSISKDGGYSPKGLKFYKGEFKEHHVLNFGDVLFANTDLTRNGDVVGSPLFFDGFGFSDQTLYSMDLSKLKVDPCKTDAKFLYFLLMTHRVKRWMVNSSAGSTVLHLDTKRVREITLNLPPLTEQKKIASILTSVDEVIESTQKQIDKLQDLKKATMNELLTKGIGHTEFKDSELGRIPKSWEVNLIGEVCEVGTGKKDTQNKTKYGKYPFFVRSQTIERIDSYSFDGEAILTAGDGVGTGKVFHYVNGKFDFHQRVYKLSDFGGGALGKFLYYCFSNRFLKQVQQFSARGSVESVRMEMITGMAIPLPSIQEQSKIVDCISAIETNISIGKQKLSQTQSLKKSLMQELLTGKVRVTVN
jgi:type I restriction enzyme, S subunit